MENNKQCAAEEEEAKQMEMEKNIAKRCHDFLQDLHKEFNLKCGTVLIMPINGKFPVAAFHGEKLDYAELISAVSFQLRDEILERLGISPGRRRDA